MALLSKELVTIRQRPSGHARSRRDAHSRRPISVVFARCTSSWSSTAFAKSAAMSAAEHGQSETPAAAASEPAPPRETKYTTVEHRWRRSRKLSRAPGVPRTSRSTSKPWPIPRRLREVDPLRSPLVGLTIAVAPGEAYYFPLAHRERADDTKVISSSFADMAPAEPEPKGPGKR